MKFFKRILNFKNLLLIFLAINTAYLILENRNNELYTPNSLLHSLKQTTKFILYPPLEFLGLKSSNTLSSEIRFFKQNLESIDNYSFAIKMQELSSADSHIITSLQKSLNFPLLDNIFLQGGEHAIYHSFDGINSSKVFTYSDDYTNNVLPLLALLASEVVHGDKDDSKDFSTKLQALSYRTLRLSCGHISDLALNILDSLDIPARKVSTLTLEKWNTYDNGHTLIEVFIKDYNKWVLVDLDLKKVFLIVSQNSLASALDFYNIPFEQIKIVNLVDTTIIDYSREKYNTTNEYLYYLTDEWYKKMFQTLGIVDTKSKKTFFPVSDISSHAAIRIGEYPNSSFTVIDHEEFTNRFYSQQ